MIKVEKRICKENFEITEDGVLGTFTKGEIYFVRNSKKGHTVVMSNEGQWIAFKHHKLSNYGVNGVLGNRFDKVGYNLYFKNLKELRRMSV